MILYVCAVDKITITITITKVSDDAAIRVGPITGKTNMALVNMPRYDYGDILPKYEKHIICLRNKLSD